VPTNTYTALATVTLGGSDADITFASIPATYRDLVVIADIIPTAATQDIRLRFNGDSGNNYAWVEAGGNGSVTYTGATSSTSAIVSGYLTTSSRIAIQNQIMDYSATDKHKSVLVRQSAAGEAVTMRAGRWGNTAAITSITLVTATSTFASGTTFSLYGIVS